MEGWVWSNGGMILTGETEVLVEKYYTVLVVDGCINMEQWWNDTDRGNWNNWRKTLYSVDGRWMDEYGAMVEWYWQGKLKYWEKNLFKVWVIDGWMSMEQWWKILTAETEVLGEKPYRVWVVDGWMSMEQWWIDTYRETWIDGEKRYTVWVVDGWMSMEQWWEMILTGENEVLFEIHYTACVVDGWISIEKWWNYTDRGSWITVRKTLYSVGGRWMDEYGAMVEW